MIMIIGSEGDFHAKHIFEKLQAQGVACFYLDTRTFPKSLRLNLSPKDRQHPGTLITPEGQEVALESIQSVYWRYHHGIEIAPTVPVEVQSIIYREIEAALGSLFRLMPNANWVNSWAAVEGHKFKPHQLSLMAQAGIPIPDTLISNDPDAIRRFFDKHRGNVIYKPVAGGAHTAKMKPEDFAPERMKDLAQSPVQFQEMIEGADIRVYLIGEDFFAAEIKAETLDFRDTPGADIACVELPNKVKEQCRKAAQLMQYQFTGIDIKRTPRQEYIFLEANPSPMFVHFENMTGYPISESLMNLLRR